MNTTIAEFYQGRNVLITGASGFIGKQLLEKLLRSCPKLGTIYVLLRPGKDESPAARIKAILKSTASYSLSFSFVYHTLYMLYCIIYCACTICSNPCVLGKWTLRQWWMMVWDFKMCINLGSRSCLWMQYIFKWFNGATVYCRKLLFLFGFDIFVNKVHLGIGSFHVNATNAQHPTDSNFGEIWFFY